MQTLKEHFLKLFKKHLSGKKQFQKLFNFTKILSIQGLNYVNGGDIEKGGEAHLMRELSKKYTDDRTYIIFDVGANQGGYTSALLENMHVKNLQIWCFEPSANTFRNLQSNLGSNTNVLLNNIGFSDQGGSIPLYYKESASDLSSLFPLEIGYGTKEKLSDFEIVTIKKIDDFVIENNIPYIDFLKLDIEGNELNALSGAAETIKLRKVKAIQFEFGTCNIDSRTFFRDFWNLLSQDYYIYRIVKNGLYPIIRYTEFEEVFQTINFYAELK
jgi:FkbM family methyltransferase